MQKTRNNINNSCETGRKDGKKGRQTGSEESERLQCGHVVESQVQLLAESLALQLLSVHLVWKHTHTHTQKNDSRVRKDEEKKQKKVERMWFTP